VVHFLGLGSSATTVIWLQMYTENKKLLMNTKHTVVPYSGHEHRVSTRAAQGSEEAS